MRNYATRSFTSQIFVTPAMPVQLCAPRDRDSLFIHNSAGYLFVRLGGNASVSDYTFRLSPNSTLSLDDWGGAVTAIKQAGSSYIMFTEII